MNDDLLSVLSRDQRAALAEAARRAGLSQRDFVLRALATACAHWGVALPPDAIQRAPLPPLGAQLRRAKGGRPRRAARGLHAMDREVPAGYFRRVCPVCGRDFRSDAETAVYCSSVCNRAAKNKRYYARKIKKTSRP